jgi:peptidoglycan/xylan/chitin deacetylase (PgdA/CDA1 family)
MWRRCGRVRDHAHYRLAGDDDAIAHLTTRSGGDGRQLLTSLEVAIALAATRRPGQAGPHVDLQDAEDAIGTRALRYGRDDHYDVISAFIKSEMAKYSKLVKEEPDQPGFNWGLPFGAKTIGEILAGTCSLRLVKELRTPLYRIQLFRRNIPEVIELAQPTTPPPDIAADIVWDGGSFQRKEAIQTYFTERLPILKYSRVAPMSPSVLAGYHVSPKLFMEQIEYLHDAGFYSVSLEDWRAAKDAKWPLPGRAVLLTFDGCALDFLTHVWPLLKRYGFSALVLLVADEIGRSNSWRFYGEEIPLLGWDEIRQLRKEGVEFGSLSASHRPLTSLSVDEIVREGARSRAILERGLGEPIQTFAYPYGDTDRVVQHLIGACGYVFGLSSEPGLDSLENSLPDLPRIEVTGSDRFQDFIVKLNC